MKKNTFVFILMFLVLSSVSVFAAGNTWNDSFNKSKKILERMVYSDQRITFYCGCPYDPRKNVQSCPDYAPVNGGKRSTRIEWEHIVPAAHFGQSFREWREGDPGCVDNRGRHFKGRNCASKISIPYRYMESDMYNLVPAVGEVNGLRSNYRFGMVSGPGSINVCGMKIDVDARTVEPPEHLRGFIARTFDILPALKDGDSRIVAQHHTTARDGSCFIEEL